MELISGNIFIRRPDDPMKKDEVVVGHQHNFDHTTFVMHGGLEISLFKKGVLLDAFHRPLKGEVAESWLVRAGDKVNWKLILRGRFHMLRALEDGTVYQCIYSHRFPQALSPEYPGTHTEPPLTKRDEHGSLWMRLDETIVQDTGGWVAAYK